MKKTQIAAMLMIAAAATVSCSKENVGVQNTENQAEPVTICATVNAFGNPGKAELKYRYDVVWNTNDEIAVKDASGAVSTFGLTSGEGTVKGTFSKKSGNAPAGAAEAFYPASLVNESVLEWPAVQDNETIVPMYAAVDAIAAGENAVDFNSLGAMFRIMFTTDVKDIAIESVTLTALGENDVLSGTFTVNEGKAVMAAGGSRSVKVEPAEPVAVSGKHGVFNISIPAGTYADGFEMVFTTADGKYCKMVSSKSFTIDQNTVNLLILEGNNYKHVLPAEALPGEFSVSSGKTVHFAKGNLTYDVNAAKWGFFEHQYDYATAYNANLISLFSWGLGEWSTNPQQKTATSGDFVDWGTAIDNKGTWRTPTKAEMNYLLNSRGAGMSKLGVTVCGAKCLVLVPDGNTLEIADSYDETSWAAAEAAGFVCLPYVGYGNAGVVSGAGSSAYYWLYTTEGAPKNSFNIAISGNTMSISPSGREWGYAVRLIVD